MSPVQTALTMAYADKEGMRIRSWSLIDIVDDRALEPVLLLTERLFI